MKNPLQNLPIRAVRLALGALAFIVPIAVAQSQNAVSASGENCLTVECESSQITNACGQPVNFAVCHAADHKGCLFALGKTTPPIGAGETLPFACVAGKIPKVGGCFPPFVPASVSRAEYVCLPDPDNPESSAASAGQPAPVLAAATEPPPTRESPPEKTATERLLESELNPFWTDENEWTQLHWAAAADDGEAVRRLLELGAALNITDKGDGSDFSDQGNKRFKLLGKEQDGWKNTGDTPLVVAVGFNSAVAVSVLLANGAEVNAKGKDGRTPLHFAAGDNRAEIAKLLIENGAGINAKNNKGATPLHWAAWANAAEVAELLIDKGAEVNVKGEGGNTPLHSAARGNAAEVAKMLIEGDAEVNAKDEYGLTPLYWAAENNAAEVAKLLIDKGAAVNAKVEKGDYAGWTPMDAAIHKEHGEVQSILKRRRGECNKKCPSPQNTATEKLLQEKGVWDGKLDMNVKVNAFFNASHLHFAARENDMAAARWLIDKGAEVNAKDEYGLTPLYWAARRNAAEVAKLLIDKGAEVNVKGNYGRAPLYAAGQNAAEVAKLLIDNGAEAGKGTKLSPAGIRKMERFLNTSPLHLAVLHNDLEQVRSLIESENINKKIEGIWSPLRVAVLQNNLSMVKLLVDQGAEIEMPLIFSVACYLGDPDLIQFFIERGADVNKVYKGTCLHRASQAVNLETIQFLVERKRVDINSQEDAELSDKGWTPLMMLVSYGFPRGEGDSYEVNLSQFYEAFRFLVNQGADVRTVDSKGRTILHILAERDRTVDLTQDIVSKGLSMNVQDKEGQTPLHVAAQNSLQALQSLIDLGADVNIQDNNGKTPLHLAVQKNEAMAAQILIARKADVNTKAENGVTPLHTAAGQNAAGIAKLLVANGAEVNAKDKDGATPLHWANGVASTKALIEGGAEVNVKDGKGETPLDAAIGDGNDEMQSFLRQHGGRCKGFLGYKKC